MKSNKQWTQLFLGLLFIIALNGCKGSSDGTPAAATSPTPTGPTVTLSGTLTYDYVSASTGKLNYAGTTQLPMRNVYVKLLNSNTDTVLGSTSTNDSGQYSISVADGSPVKLRIYAEMKTPPVIIQNNTASKAQYTLLSSNFTISGNTTKDVNAASGWSGSNAAGSYTSTRAAAPFAMLDSIYTITKKMSAARPALVFPTCKINWSISNIAVSGDKTIGQIGTSHYSSADNELYILGQADVDSDEFDKHVIVHEWGHYFENNLSRSDSGGGSHGTGDKKDMSLAFGEGWGNALSAMTFDPDVLYTDTSGARQQSGFQINMESGADANKGWFSETSVQQILYDIYDTVNEAGDNLSLGIGPIVDVFTGFEKTTTAATSIFSFVHGLKASQPATSADLDTLVATKSIDSITSQYGTGETHDGGWNKNLPVYNSITLGGAAVPVSLYGDFGASDFYGLFNTVFNNKYLRFTATTTTTRLVVTTTDTFQIEVYKKGVQVAVYYRQRTSAAAIGPFTFNITTVAGQEYSVLILTAQDVVFDSAAVVDLTVTGSAI
ncbi:MAG: hypothetical protein WC635_12795 [Bacteriovorax sp.]|jgi:hypothetical protein